MPNAYNKVRTNNLLKLEKDNENNVIRRKLKSGTAATGTAGIMSGVGKGMASERVPISRRLERNTVATTSTSPPVSFEETSWERSTGLRHSPSSESTSGIGAPLGSTRSQLNMLLQRRSSHYLQLPLRSSSPYKSGVRATHAAVGHGISTRVRTPHSAGQGAVRQPLSPCTAVNSHASRRQQSQPPVVATAERQRQRVIPSNTTGITLGGRAHACKRPKTSGSFAMLCTGNTEGNVVLGHKTIRELLTARCVDDSKSSSRSRSTKSSKEATKSSNDSPKSSKGSAKSSKDSAKHSADSKRSSKSSKNSPKSLKDSTNSTNSSKESKDSPQSSKNSTEGRNLSSPRYDDDDLSDWDDYSQDSMDDYYETAPLIPVPTVDSLHNIHSVGHRLRNVLQRRNQAMAPDELDTIKQVVKTDERHRDRRRDDAKLFRDILKSQLHEILRQELVVKSALCKLESSADCCGRGGSGSGSKAAAVAAPELETMLTMEMQQSTTTCSATSETCDSQRPKVDVIFKNVPTLEKEIFILKALGEQLEETLRNSGQAKGNLSPTTPVPCPTVAAARAVCERVKESGIQVTAIHCSHHVSLPEHVAQWASTMANVRGVRHEVGVVREFRIAQRTIIELREHANKHFYLPVSGSGAGSVDGESELRRTSYRRLKEKPDVLMQYLRAKNSGVQFNVLEQDPIFFNSIFNSHSGGGATGAATILKSTVAIADATSDDSNDSGGSNKSLVTSAPSSCGSPRQNVSAHKSSSEERELETITETSVMHSYELCPQTPSVVPIPIPASPPTSSETLVPIIEVSNDHPPEAPPVLVKARRRPPKRHAKPKRTKCLKKAMAASTVKNLQITKCQADLESPRKANELFKTILVGVVQITVFVVMIIAITYPDVKC